MEHRSTTVAASRIVVVEDHALLAESLELALSLEGYDVRRLDPDDLASTPAALLSTLRRLRPRLVLLDLDLGAFGHAARLIRPSPRAASTSSS